MGYKIVINGEGVSPEEVTEHISSYKHNSVKNIVACSDHGNDPAVCSGWSTNIIDIIGIATVLFFAIPEATQKIRDTCAEWENIFNDLKSFFIWFKKTYEISSYSIEVVFLDALKHLSSKTDVIDLTLVHYIELPATRFKDGNSFNYAITVYYQYIFENALTGHTYLLLYNSQRKLLIDSDLGMFIGQNNEINVINK